MNNNKRSNQVLDPPSGLARTASIKAADSLNFSIQFDESKSTQGSSPRLTSLPASYPLIDSSGLFIGSLPSKNTTITVQQELGGRYHFVSYETQNRNIIPDLKPGELLIHSTDRSKISLDLDSHIRIGSDTNNIHIFAGSKKFLDANLVTFNLENENHFTQAYREVGGIIKRDVKPNLLSSSASGSTKLEDDAYFNSKSVKAIGLDPSSSANDILAGPTKNPPFVEHRELVYEFQYKSAIDDENTEANKYKTSSSTTFFSTQNRRSNRVDTLSLSLVSPNFLIEQIKGTVVDIYGNILDINRLPLPVGLSANTTLRTGGTVATTDAKESYINIRALERKSIAYHFELNARKDPKPRNQGSELSINDDNYNAKLQRSRFFFDIDKEGQFKLNVPASSEVGNVPLLTRPENYSSFATTDGGNPNQTWFIESGQPVSQDIFVDSFAAPQTIPSSSEDGFENIFAHGSIQLVDTTNDNADAGPPDRISQFVQKNIYNIKHGTAYHDILQTCSLHQNNACIEDYQLKSEPDPIDTSYIDNLDDLVSLKIKVSGPDANAGGRSGSINLDGSLEMNIGANTIDKQSLWIDTAGGIVSNIGRDRNNRSAMMNFDGDVFIQIGGYGLAAKDARFLDKDGIHIGVLDLRVFAGGFAHMFRVDPFGVTVLTPQTLNLYAAQGIYMQSDSAIFIDSPQLHLNHRLVTPPDSPGVSTSI